MVGPLSKLFGIDLRSLALFRIVVGLIVLADLAIRAGDLAAFYTDAGVVPRSLMSRGTFPSLHALSGSAEWEAFLFGLAALVAVALIVGWHTRIATIVSWYLLASLQMRNMAVLNAGDSLFRIMLFWGMFLPLGKVWSFDARRNRSAAETFGPVCSVASACLLLQTCIVYWVSAYFKSNEVWREGDALYYAFSYDAYARPLATYLLQFPELLRYLSVGALMLESLGPLLAFMPWKTSYFRLVVIAAFVSLHVSIELTLTVGLFSYVSLLTWIPFLPAVFWNKLAGPLPRVPNTPAEKPAEPTRESQFAPRLCNTVCLGSMALILAYCYSTTELPGAKTEGMKRVAGVATNVMFTQNWSMFGRPTRFDGWCIAAARLADGRTVDLLRAGAPIDWEKPNQVVNIHPNHRWRKYFAGLASKAMKKYRPHLCSYLAAQWDADRPKSAQVQWLDLYLVKEWTPVRDEPLEHQTVLLHHERVTAQGAFAEAMSEPAKTKGAESVLGDLPPGL